jgi:hypothetical protein
MADAWIEFMPLPVDDVVLAFGASGSDLKRLAPMLGQKCERTAWQDVAERWFYVGIERSSLQPKAGINPRDALRHAGAVLASFEPEHNAKMRAVGWLLSLWFDAFTPSDPSPESFRARVASLAPLPLPTDVDAGGKIIDLMDALQTSLEKSANAQQR